MMDEKSPRILKDRFEIEVTYALPTPEELSRVCKHTNMPEEFFLPGSWRKHPSCQRVSMVPARIQIRLVSFDANLTREDCIRELRYEQLRPALPEEAWAFAQARIKLISDFSLMILVHGAELQLESDASILCTHSHDRGSFVLSLISFEKPFDHRMLYMAVPIT